MVAVGLRVGGHMRMMRVMRLVRVVSSVGGLIRVGHGEVRSAAAAATATAAAAHVAAVWLRVLQFAVAVAVHHGHARGAVVVLLRHIGVHLVIVVSGVGISPAAATPAAAVVAVVLHVVVPGAVIAFDVATTVVRTKAHLVRAQRTAQSHLYGTAPTAATPGHLLAFAWEMKKRETRE